MNTEIGRKVRPFLPDGYGRIILAWHDAARVGTFRTKLMLSPFMFWLYSSLTQPLGNYVEARKGIKLKDAVLSVFPSGDHSTSIFVLLYSSIILFLLAHLGKPKLLLRVLELHLIIALVRQVCILGIPLEPPEGMISLRDIFLENTFYPTGKALTRDLFFSGHVASIWLYCLCAQNKYLKVYFGFATLLMSLMVLCMRIHYTYDVYGALLFTSLIYLIPFRLERTPTKVDIL